MANRNIGRHAARGGRTAAKRRLTLDRVEHELPPLESLETAMVRLDRVGLWAAAGMLTGSVASAVVRSVEVWIRGHESQLTREVVDGLRRDVARLKAEMLNNSPTRGTRR